MSLRQTARPHVEPQPGAMESPLDSVIRLEEGIPPLVRLSDHALVDFHTKCWGQDLSSYQTPLSHLGRGTTSEDDDRPQGVPAIAGDEKGKAKDKATSGDDEDELMDDDWRELDDIIPGTCVFDIGIKRLPLPPILIRADYIRMFNAIKDYFSGV